MKKIITIKLYSILFFLIFTGKTFADASNPEEAPEDIAATPIGDYAWVLALIGILYIYFKFQPMQKKPISIKK